MAAYYSIAVVRAGEIVSRSLAKADMDTTLRSLFGMYEGGKHAIGFMDLAVKAGTRTAVFEQHDATMDLVDLDMPIRLVREICGDVTKFLFQVAPAIVAAPALVPPPVATPPPPVATPPTPVAASKPKPVAAPRGRKPRKAVVVDSFLRESDLNRIGDMITVARRVVAKPATKPTVRCNGSPAPATRPAEVFAQARPTAALPGASASTLARAKVALTIPPINKNALSRILESVRATKSTSRPASPKALRARPHYSQVAHDDDDDDDDEDDDDDDSDASVADDDSDIPVAEAHAAKRASRRPAPSSPPPRRELRIPQVHKTSVARSRTKRLPVRRTALRESASTEMVLSADGAGNVLASPPQERSTRRTSAPTSAEKGLPLRTSTRNKSIVEISSDDEARPVPALTTRLSVATPTSAVESPQARHDAARTTPRKQPQPPTPPVSMARSVNTTPHELPDVAAPKAGTPEMARRKRLLSLDDAVEEQVHDLSPPAKRRLSSSSDVQLASSPSVPNVHATDEANDDDEENNEDPRSAIEDELATLLHEASAVELVQLREANPNDQANFLGEELNEVKRHVLLQKTAAGLFQVAFKRASDADIAPHENPNVVLTNLFMNHDDDWSRVAHLVGFGRMLRPAP